MAKGWRSLARASGSAVGKMAVRVYVCRGCGVHHRGRKPMQCHCGRMDFTSFDSQGEANYWARLEMMERAGLIWGLQRQVRFPLMAHRKDGLAVKVAEYVSDYVYEDKEGIHICDFKGALTDVAALKLRWMEAQGMPVTVITAKGKV